MPFIDTSTLQTGERLPGWKGRSFNSETMTFAHFSFEAGSKIHEHAHSNEEVWTVIEGELEVSVGADTVVAGPGHVAIVPPNTAHRVKAVTNGKAIVTDCPVRIDASGGRRAVVKIDFDSPVALPEDPVGNPMQIPFTLRNSGKTAAVVSELAIESGIALALPGATSTKVPGGELPTLCRLEADDAYSGTIPQPGLAPSALGQVSNGASVFYVKGIVFYDDGFGSRQHSTFCRIYDRNAFDGQGGFVAPEKPGYNYGT
jgi:quercetin dioxygenase-like cupin family protein